MSSSSLRRERPTRSKSPYNVFMKGEIDRIKEENPMIPHKEVFILASANWNRCRTYEKPVKYKSPYNAFMKEEIVRVKKENPTVSHKQAFILASANWDRHKNLTGH